MTINKARLALLIGLAVGCGNVDPKDGNTPPGSLSCADGFCSDPARPFCDQDGAIGGTPDTCIAVACEPRAFETCRGDDAVFCNDAGTNFDVTHCDVACSAATGGCLTCQTDAECTNPTPHCDAAAGSCRACTADSECASGVCLDSGACEDEASIVYAAPSATATSGCTKAAPCSVTAAFAQVTETRDVIKLGGGVYTASSLSPAGARATIHGFGATINGFNPILVNQGQRVTIRGLTAKTTQEIASGISCIADTGVATLELDRVSIQAGLTGIGARGCLLTVDRSTITLNSQFGAGIRAQGSATAPGTIATVRSTRFTGPVGILVGVKSEAHVSNSVFHNVTASAITVVDENGGIGKGDVKFSTFVNSPIACGDGPVVMTFANNIMVGAAGTNVAQGTRCAHDFAVVTPGNVLPPGGTHFFRNVDPKFANAAAGDFHLLAGSPAADIADPTVVIADDFDGVPRPQGTGRDLGAFELKPQGN
jgi:hypothetical protein